MRLGLTSRGMGLSRRVIHPLAAYAEGGRTPRVVADFVTETYGKDESQVGTFGDLLSLSRASTATYFDSSGVMQTASSGTARVGHHRYEGGAWVNKGLLHESESRTNLLTQSESFDHADWTDIATPTVTADSDVAPDGAQTADTLTDDSLTDLEGKTRTMSVADDSLNRTFTLFVKKDSDETRFPEFQLRYTGGTTTLAYIVQLNTSTGATTTRGTDTPTVSVEDNDTYWRLRLTGANNGTGNTTIRVTIYPAITATFGSTEVTTTGSVVIWGAQLEEGDIPSSYIPTTTASATRAAEVLTISAANMSYSSTAMSIQMEGEVSYVDSDGGFEVIFYVWDASSTEQIRGRLSTSGGATGTVVIDHYASGLTDAVFVSAYSPALNVAYNIASRHTDGAFNGAVDGTAMTEDTDPTAMPAVSGADMELGDTLMGTIALFRQWDADIGDSGVAEATT